MAGLFVGTPNSFIGGVDSYVGGFPPASINVTLGGIQLGLSQSSLTSSFSKSLNSQLLALSHGNLTYSAGADVIVTLTGIAMTLSQSNLIYRLDKSLCDSVIAIPVKVTITSAPAE